MACNIPREGQDNNKNAGGQVSSVPKHQENQSMSHLPDWERNPTDLLYKTIFKTDSQMQIRDQRTSGANFDSADLITVT